VRTCVECACCYTSASVGCDLDVPASTLDRAPQRHHAGHKCSNSGSPSTAQGHGRLHRRRQARSSRRRQRDGYSRQSGERRPDLGARRPERSVTLLIRSSHGLSTTVTCAQQRELECHGPRLRLYRQGQRHINVTADQLNRSAAPRCKETSQKTLRVTDRSEDGYM